MEHVRERKSNAAKQFAYNKLKNENYVRAAAAAVAASGDRTPVKNAPQRPPQPKLPSFDPKDKDKEGMLIDLTSPQQHDITNAGVNRLFTNKFVHDMNGLSILDAPIDVPTEEFEPEAAAIHFESARIDPPPYQSPPMYSNADRNKSTDPDLYQNLDPFDTSHIAEMALKQQQQLQHHQQLAIAAAPSSMTECYVSTKSISSLENSILLRNNSSLIDEALSSRQMLPQNSKPNRSSMYAPVMMHQSPKNDCTTTAMHSSSTESLPLKQFTDDMLSDSLRVNLSALSLNDSSELASSSLPATNVGAADEPKKLDRNFLAQLEKNITKAESTNPNVNMNVNIRQPNDLATVNAKEASVTTISGNALAHGQTYWMQNDTNTGAYGMGQTQSPSKYNATNEAMKNMSTTLAKKTHNIDVCNMSGAGTNQTNTDSTIYGNHDANQMNGVAATASNMNGAMVNGDMAIYGNYGANATNGGQTIQPAVMGGGGTSDRIYYSSNFYDSVAQSVIYDEVAAEVEYMSRLRPHRSAPVAPLSAQQIQRRLEKAQKEQIEQMYGNVSAHNTYSNGYGPTVPRTDPLVYEEINQNSQQRIQSLMKDISNDATEQEAKDALHAVNWDHNQAVRYFKIERLLR